jgi:hypothetical protein
LRLAKEEVTEQECHCDTKIKTLAYGFVLIIGHTVLRKNFWLNPVL